METSVGRTPATLLPKTIRAAKQITKRYRLGLYNPLGLDEPPIFVGPVYTSAWLDSFTMGSIINLFNDTVAGRDDVDYCLAVYEVEE